jgi:hypothetical protein
MPCPSAWNRGVPPYCTGHVCRSDSQTVRQSDSQTGRQSAVTARAPHTFDVHAPSSGGCLRGIHTTHSEQSLRTGNRVTFPGTSPNGKNHAHMLSSLLTGSNKISGGMARWAPAEFCLPVPTASCGCMGSVHGVSAWGRCIMWLHGVAAWGHCMGSLHGVAAWGRCMGSVHGVAAWGRCMGSLHGVAAWGRCMGSLHGVAAWGRCMGSVHGVSAWGRCMGSLHALYISALVDQRFGCTNIQAKQHGSSIPPGAGSGSVG